MARRLLLLTTCLVAACGADETESSLGGISVAGAAGAAGSVSGAGGGAGKAGGGAAGKASGGTAGQASGGAAGKASGGTAGVASGGAAGQVAGGAAGVGGATAGKSGAAGMPSAGASGGPSGGQSGAAGATSAGTAGSAGQPAKDPCEGRQNGKWCGQANGGDPDFLYDCQGDKTASKVACQYGCSQQPPGVADLCKPGPSVYQLPFPCGVAHTCTQGNNGSTSHSGKEAYAWDFGMNVGSDVVAARAGTVSHADFPSPPGSGCFDGGDSSCANLANRIVVDHGDGTSAAYYHLSSLSVSKGQTVAQGQLVGKSGNSGWSTGPHLHFMVMQTCGIWYCQSIATSFGDVGVPTSVNSYTSGNCH